MKYLPFPEDASNVWVHNISADGSVIAGLVQMESGAIIGFRWSGQSDMTDIGSDWYRPRDLNSNGNVIVGNSTSTETGYIWTHDRGLLEIGERILDVTADGTIATGRGKNTGIVWDKYHGERDLQKLLTSHYGLGQQLEGWQLTEVAAIADDGLTLLGGGMSPDGEHLTWLIDIDRRLVSDIEGDFDVSGQLDLADINELAIAIQNGRSLLAYDLTDDGQFTIDDLNHWTHTLANTWTGDVNLDGSFNSEDLVSVTAAGEYETRGGALWSEGDWNADGRFTSADLVAAIEEGGYEKGPRNALLPPAPVPEPGGPLIVTLGAAIVIGLRHRQVMSAGRPGQNP